MGEHALALSWLVGVTFIATALQGLAGFGFALILMPFMTMILGVRTAAPLVALTALTLYSVNCIRYRESLNLRELWRLGVTAVVGVPVGIWVVASAEASVVKVLLGWLLIGYGVYSIVIPRSPRRCSSHWAYLAGFLSGSLGGAYNTSGPPLVVYGALRQWPKNEFRAGLQSLFLVSAILTVIAHTVARQLTPTILQFYAWTLPALFLGIVTSLWVDPYVDKARFHNLVTGMILLLGVSLALNLGRG